MSRHLHRKTGYVSPIWINIISNRRAQRILISFAKRGPLGSVNLVKSTNNWGFKKYDIMVWNGSKWFRIGPKRISFKTVLKCRRPSKGGNYWLAEWMSVFRKDYIPYVSNVKTNLNLPTQSYWNTSRMKVSFSPVLNTALRNESLWKDCVKARRTRTRWWWMFSCMTGSL